MNKLLWLLALVTCAGTLHPQQSNAPITATQDENRITVSGTIKDPSGAVVPNVEIVLKLQKCKCKDCKPPQDIDCGCCANQIAVQSDSNGNFSFSAAHGTYELSIDSRGRSARLPLDLNEGISKTVNVTVK